MAKSVTPLIAKMRGKALAIKPRRRVSNIPREVRRANAQRSQENQRNLQQDVEELWQKEDELVNELALKHGKSAKWMKRRVQRTTKYGQEPRKINAYNAWLHCCSLEINESKRLPRKVDNGLLTQT